MGGWLRSKGTTTRFWASPATPTRTRSGAPSTGWPASTTPTWPTQLTRRNCFGSLPRRTRCSPSGKRGCCTTATAIAGAGTKASTRRSGRRDLPPAHEARTSTVRSSSEASRQLRGRATSSVTRWPSAARRAWAAARSACRIRSVSTAEAPAASARCHTSMPPASSSSSHARPASGKRVRNAAVRGSFLPTAGYAFFSRQGCKTARNFASAVTATTRAPGRFRVICSFACASYRRRGTQPSCVTRRSCSWSSRSRRSFCTSCAESRRCLGRVISALCRLDRARLRGGTANAAAAAPTTPMEMPQQYRDAWSSTRRRVLVVDDDPSLRLLLRVTLAADEFEIEEVASAEEAWEVARFWRPSVVLLDVTLPGLDGLSFCKQLTNGAAGNGPAVIMLTGTAMSPPEAQAAGARAVLHKPFSPLELLVLIDRLDEMPNELLVGRSEGDAEQLLIYARDLSRISEVERA